MDDSSAVAPLDRSMLDAVSDQLVAPILARYFHETRGFAHAS